MKSVYYAFFFSLSLVAMILQQKAQKCKNHIFSGFFRHKVLKCKRHLSACNKKLSMSSLNLVFDQLLYFWSFFVFAKSYANQIGNSKSTSAPIILIPLKM